MRTTHWTLLGEQLEEFGERRRPRQVASRCLVALKDQTAGALAVPAEMNDRQGTRRASRGSRFFELHGQPVVRQLELFRPELAVDLVRHSLISRISSRSRRRARYSGLRPVAGPRLMWACSCGCSLQRGYRTVPLPTRSHNPVRANALDGSTFSVRRRAAPRFRFCQFSRKQRLKIFECART